jgi:hypothetical protein
MGKFNKKKSKMKHIFVRITIGGKWHVASHDKPDKRVFIPCQPYQTWGQPVEFLEGIEHGPFDGFIFTKPHKICGTCMRMERNRKTLKEAGFIT